MTDRIKSLTVVLEQDTRTDDVEVVVSAIEMIRGVLKVELHKADSMDFVAENRVRRELIDKLYDVLK